MSDLENRLEEIVLKALGGSSESLNVTLEEISERLRGIEDRMVKFEDRMEGVEDSIKPLTEAYNGIIFGRKVIVGLASLTLGVATLGGIIITALNHFRR